MADQEIKKETDYDISVIRPLVQHDDVRIRKQQLDPSQISGFKKNLRTLHTLELMATNTYKFQITSRDSEINRELIAAMCNEMTHYQDFQVKLYEYGFKPSILRVAFWMVGFTFGFLSRLLGKKATLKVGIWVEEKAVSHYDEILDSVDWDDDTRELIKKNQADEVGHITRWKKLLESTR